MAQQQTITTGFLRDLFRNTAGNVLAITAAATLPMMGVIGGAVDISRVYLVKSRVQAACDSAVLAGRKAMSTLTYTSAAQTRATSMFNVNFQNADYGTTSTSFTSSANASGMVTGTATTTVPMVLMSIFGQSAKTVSVTCSADVQVPNIDVVFVLDVTGSMDDCPDGNCNNSPAGEQKKIVSLRAAVKSFYTTLQTALVGNTTSQVRYGFVPYSQMVNGKDLFKASPDLTKGEIPLNNMQDMMEVQSKVANFTTAVTQFVQDASYTPTTVNQVFDNSVTNSKEPFVASSTSGTGISTYDCDQYGTNFAFNNGNTNTDVYLYPRTSFPGEGVGDAVLYQKDGTGSWLTSEPTNASTYYYKLTFERVSFVGGNATYKICTRRVTKTKFIKQTGYKFTNWTYKPVNLPTTVFRTGAALNFVSAIDPNRLVATSGSYDQVTMRGWADQSGLTSDSTTWDGCIEERTTTPAATFTPIPANAYDLNVLDGGTTDTLRWRPVMGDLTYRRGQVANLDTTSSKSNPNWTCPSARMRNLQVMNQTDFNAYADTLSPGGSTYLDIGMQWGLRLISAQGMFSYRNLTGPNGGQISRHIIFLTDGTQTAATSEYTGYGVEEMAQRVAGGSTNPDALTRHARRFQALCDLERGGVSIWVIGFGTSITGNLTNCADPGRAFEANNTTDLNNAFRTIAQDVADLRLVS